MEVPPVHSVIGYLLNSVIGASCTTFRQYKALFLDSKDGVPDSLLIQSIRTLFKNGDFTDFHDGIVNIVQGKNLALFANSLLSHCPDIMKIICENAYAKSRKLKFMIKRDQWAICIGRGRLITFPFTVDMREPARLLAEYTRMFFSNPLYDIEFAFEGSYGLNRNIELTANHIKLLSSLGYHDFAEKGREKRGRERNGRLTVRMCRISWQRSGIYYNAIISFFELLRGVVIVQGEQPICSIKKSYEEVLNHVFLYPDSPLLDENPSVASSFSNKRKRMGDESDDEDEKQPFYACLD